MFWHFIGFWGFMSEVVLAGGAPLPAVHATLSEAGRPVQVAGVSAAQTCTLLSLDRRTGITSARPCDADQAPLPLTPVQGRQDRMPSAVETGDDAGRSADGAPSP